MENNFQLIRIHNYLTGLMSSEEMHALEQEALNDPFLQDAIDGYRLQNGVDKVPLSLLQKRLAARVKQRHLDYNLRFFGWQRLTVGLVAAVMFVVISLLLVFRHIHSDNYGATASESKQLVAGNLRVQVVPEENSNAHPRNGWDQFSRKLHTKLTNFPEAHSVDVQFSVVEGSARKITVLGTTDALFVERLKMAIQEEIVWEGTAAHFKVHIGEDIL